jgi:hypothetical protein
MRRMAYGEAARKRGNMVSMKTTIEVPDPLFRLAKARAAERGQTLNEFVTDALQARLVPDSGSAGLGKRGWMDGFGKLRRLREETARIQGVIDATFDVVEPQDRL